MSILSLFWARQHLSSPAALLFVLVVATALWYVPCRQARSIPDIEQRLAAENDSRRTLAQILVGVGLLIGVYLAWRRIEATREGQITESFARAIEQFGSQEPGARMGAVYALERVARDSPKDHWNIMEILCAFIRDKYPIQRQDPEAPSLDQRYYQAVVAAAIVIGRRKWERDKGFIDLRNTRIFFDLQGSNFANANFSNSDLSGVKLQGANLREANFDDTHLDNAQLENADLSGAWFGHTGGRICLAGAKLDGAHLHGVDLTRAHGLTDKQVLSAHCYTKGSLPTKIQEHVEASKPCRK